MGLLSFAIHPEIISVHIPKTAGSSFHAVLKAHYGWRLKHIQRADDMRTWNIGERYKSNKPFVKAVHGHIRPRKKWRLLYPEAKWVCWLRDPAERVLSAYNHLQKTQLLQNDDNQRLFAKLQPDLKTFVLHEGFRHNVAIYNHTLGNFIPADFAFIGRTEHFEEDLQRFAKLIGAHKLPVAHLNVSDASAQKDEEVLHWLRTQLREEYTIYNTYINAFYP